jgi:hypothetical protein
VNAEVNHLQRARLVDRGTILEQNLRLGLSGGRYNLTRRYRKKGARREINSAHAVNDKKLDDQL